MKRPLFSCVVPVKGPRPFFGEALASLRLQELGEDLEVIVQDGDVEPDAGLSDALNRGFAKAHGEWLFWLNADDLLLPGALVRVRRLISAEPSVDWIAGNMVNIDAGGRVMSCLRDRGAKKTYARRPVRTYCPSSFFRSELFAQAGGFDVSLTCCMDTDLWMRFRAGGHWFRKLPAYLFAFRRHDGSLTTSRLRDGDELRRQADEIRQMLARQGVRLSRGADFCLRLRRFLDGSYLRGAWDTMRWRGRRLGGPVKICWWTCQPTTYQTALVEALREGDVDVEVCYYRNGYDDYRRALGWREPQLKTWEHRVSSLRAARREVPDFAERIQMVPGFSDGISWKVISWSVLRRRSWFVYAEGSRGRWFGRPVVRLFAHLADRYALGVFAIGSRAVEQFRTAGVRSAKLVPFAYATPCPPVAADRLFDGRRLCGDVTFVYAGAFSLRKGVDVLAKAWKIVRDEFPLARLLLAGAPVCDDFGKGGKNSGDFAKTLCESPGVTCLGAIQPEKMSEVYLAGDVVVLPSRYDAWGVALAEGAMCGLAMVGCDGAGSAIDLIADGVNGTLVPSGDAESLALAMRRYAENPALARQHGAAARRTVEATRGAALAARMTSFLERARWNACREKKIPGPFCVDGMSVVENILRERGIPRDDEAWVHGMWTPDKWFRCLAAKLAGKRLVRMTHGALSPVCLEKQGKWRKRLIGWLIERPLFSFCDRLVVTGPWEEEWCRRWGLKNEIQKIDLKRYFRLGAKIRRRSRTKDEPLHVLYLGRRHALKGVDCLERAVAQANVAGALRIELRVVSDHGGVELESDWAWCDVLCLPTLSENFGLVVAEALEHGRPVITTDGAPAWDPMDGKTCEGEDGNWRESITYLRGYREGTDDARVKLLKDALVRFLENYA